MSENTNPFRRVGFGNYDRMVVSKQTDFDPTPANKPSFTGKNLHVFVNNKKVANLEQMTYSIQTETMGKYVMGRSDPQAFNKGKRAIVGSFVFAQFDEHALLEAVFELSRRRPPIRTLGDVWQSYGSGSVPAYLAMKGQIKTTYTLPDGTTSTELRGEIPGSYLNQNYGLQGMSASELNRQVEAQLQQAATIAGAQLFNYVDMLPPFDMVIIAVNELGNAARMALFGVEISQESGGYSMNELDNSLGFTFTATGYEPLRPFRVDGNTLVNRGIY
jgi:hypothetical protein